MVDRNATGTFAQVTGYEVPSVPLGPFYGARMTEGVATEAHIAASCAAFLARR
jgi:hypothetical protein